MGITRHDTEMHGNNRLRPINRMTVSPIQNIIRYRFTDIGELPIHGS